jgi:hypothetical protein
MNKKLKKWYNARIDLLKAERDLVIESLSINDNTTSRKQESDFDKSDIAKKTSMRVVPKRTQPTKRFSGPDPTIPKQGKSPINLDVDEIIRLREKGWTLKRIAKRFKVSAPTIGNRLKQAGWAPPKRESPIPHTKKTTVRKNRSGLPSEMLGFIKGQLPNQTLSSKQMQEYFDSNPEKTVSAKFSEMSMWLTDIGASWRIGKRPFVLKSRNKTKLKAAKLSDFHVWRNNRYGKN